MDVFSLLKFWRNAGVGDPTNSGDIDNDITDDEGSFFDLVFTNPNSPSLNVITGLHTDYYHHFSKFDGDSKSKSTPQTVFFNNKSKIIPLDSSNTSNSTSSSKTCKSPFRSLKLGFQFQNNLSKSEKKEMKCEIEEVTISSLLNRDNSLRNKFRSEKLLDDNHQIHSKRFSKEIVHKYLNLIKPLYVKVYKKNNDKVKSPEQSSPFTSSSQVTGSPFGKTMLKEVRKHLGKSRSSSSSNGSVKNIPSPLVRRDDSALQQQDGIQSAILHCKQSYNSPGCHVLSRSGSAPSHGPRISIDEAKRCSI